MIVVLAAVNLEIAPLRKRLPAGARVKCRKPLRLTATQGPSGPLYLGLTGMGAAAAFSATQELLAVCRPKAILSVGLTGALQERLRIGDLIIADRCHSLQPACLQSGLPKPVASTGISQEAAKRLEQWLTQNGTSLTLGSLVTCPQIVTEAKDKQRLHKLLPHEGLGIDMETAAILAAAQPMKVPVYSLRSVSDLLDEDLAVDFSRFHELSGKPQPLKAFSYFVHHPRAAWRLRHIVGNARRAAETLEQGVFKALSFPDFCSP